jgi:armadillo repeat-containing protein 8
LNPSAALLEDSGSSDDELCLEAAHIVASLAYGTEDALVGLLRADALRMILYALSRTSSPLGSHALKAALTRALRNFAGAVADVVGPARWGLRPDTATFRNDAAIALEVLFQVRMNGHHP